MSDFFIRNDQNTDEGLKNALARYLELIFFCAIHTPNKSESAMYKAAAVASKSACMSRQVGAAIVSASGELLGVGWNDVPKFGGGLYTEDDQKRISEEGKIIDADHRCFRWGKKICHNDDRKGKILNDIANRIYKTKLLKKTKTAYDVLAVVKGTGVDALIEFSRAIHAEMEAILSVAREGKNSLVGATLYTTTFPCHNCARHIVAGGIKEVIFIEPYPKSLAAELHSDAISLDEREREVVLFKQYEGVAPKNVFRLFEHGNDRKKSGSVISFDPSTATPLFQPYLDSFTLYEDKIVAELSASTPPTDAK